MTGAYSLHGPLGRTSETASIRTHKNGSRALGNRGLRHHRSRRSAGAVGKAGLVEVPHVTRSPTVAGSELAAGIMQCAAWAEACGCPRDPGRVIGWRYRALRMMVQSLRRAPRSGNRR